MVHIKKEKENLKKKKTLKGLGGPTRDGKGRGWIWEGKNNFFLFHNLAWYLPRHGTGGNDIIHGSIHLDFTFQRAMVLLNFSWLSTPQGTKGERGSVFPRPVINWALFARKRGGPALSDKVDQESYLLANNCFQLPKSHHKAPQVPSKNVLDSRGAITESKER